MLVELSPTSGHLASTPNGSRSVSPISCNGVSSASCLLMVRPARSMFHSCSSATAVVPNISLNPDASPAALRAVRSAPVSFVR